ncbi:MAG: glycoside hydrolase family 1 protein [Candidatus Jorgensenbacteria bacterium]
MNRNEPFYFGAATSAHQVEGGNRNDWTEWEIETAKSKAQMAKGNPPTGGWPDYILENYPSPLDEENYISGRAADHFNRYEEDFDIAKSLGHNAHRFSIEWSRVEPEEGKFDESALAHYRNVVKALRARGMEPFVSLSHWTIPRWFRDAGGWRSPRAPERFARYAETAARVLGDDVRFWITLNEPELNAAFGYFLGKWPPNVRSPLAYWRVLHRLVDGHRAAYAVIKRLAPQAQVGIAKHNSYFEAVGLNPWNRALQSLAQWWWNSYFLDSIADVQDFIGLNYYFHNRINWWFNRNENRTVSDVGWELYPEGIYHVVKDLARYRKPIYITENGVADARDVLRAAFIRETFRWLALTKEEGVDIRGYLHWSLIDNFEWADGFWPRFGLVEVDYRTQARRVRPSALVYRDLIREWHREHFD